MSDGERFEMPIVFRDDPPEEPEVDESPKVPPFAVWAGIVIVVALTIRFLPYYQTETDGTGVVTTTSWDSMSHWLNGAEATSRSKAQPDGGVEHGPIKNGKRHGAWTHKQKSGEVDLRNFRHGIPLP